MLGLRREDIGSQKRERGTALADLASAGTGLGLGYASISRYLSSPLLTSIPRIGLVTRAAVPLVGLAIGIAAIPPMMSLAWRGARLLSTLDQRVSGLHMGGDFRDSETAERERLRAVQQMSGSLQAARRLLGQEARFLHR